MPAMPRHTDDYYGYRYIFPDFRRRAIVILPLLWLMYRHAIRH